MVNQGSAAMGELAPARRAIVQAEISDAFRAAFLSVSVFLGMGLICALSIPVKRIA
jgi:hypothetical protein